MKRAVLFALGLLMAGASTASASFLEYYVARDTLQTFAAGTYAGQANPNFNRLTLLYAHTYPDNPTSNHYHNKSAYILTGPAGSPTIQNRPANNFLPEGNRDPLPLLKVESGPHAGHYISGLTPDVPFSNVQIGAVNRLTGFDPGSPEDILFNASAGRYTGLLDGGSIGLQIVGLTPGLTVANADGSQVISAAGEFLNMGAGNTLDFTPVLRILNPIFGQTYEATFILRDLNNPAFDSGEFRFLVTPVPEPGSLLLMGLGVGGLGLWHRRRQQAHRAATVA